MKTLPLIITTCLAAPLCMAAEEMTSTEMTEAYIQDGAIVIKQRPAQRNPQQTSNKNMKVSPGQPLVSGKTLEESQLRSDQTTANSIEYELGREIAFQQLESQRRDSISQGSDIEGYASAAQLERQEYVDNIIRSQLNLSSDTQVTQKHLQQYLNQSDLLGINGNPAGLQQGNTGQSFQFIMPNPGYTPGQHGSSNDSVSLQVTNDKIIWQFNYPQQN
ncbi:MAG: hypothetical protein H7A09_04795 [Oceanospirillaceae bacterium]|nr:hypothetical protein [Oceanospirillaceae bacterium]MCP5349440.1 hypothetical protein [Oceanospirillaceae bacterium]